MVNDSIKITYLFVSGRKSRTTSKEKYAREFFYSYDYFKNKYKSTEIIEFNDVTKYSKILKKLLSYIDRFLRKILKFPIFMHEIVNLKNFSRIMNTDILVITNDRIGFSILPIMLAKKISRKRYLSSNVFVLGLFSNLGNNFIQKFIQKIVLSFYFSTYDNFIFIGKSEYEFAINYAEKYSNKFEYIPFSIDEKFWTNSKNKKDNDILFIGNDGNRDFEKLNKISTILNELDFVYVTKNIKKEEIKQDNVTLVEGHWNYNFLTDTDIKEFYERSKLTIIPLKDSIQPSGQSVALQSMSIGTPVLISKTKGFWDHTYFKNRENIYFIDGECSAEDWAKRIKEILSNKKELENISRRGEKLIKDNFNLESFNKKMENIVGL